MRRILFSLLLICSPFSLRASSLITVFSDYGTGATQPFDPGFGNTVTASGNILSPSFAFVVPGNINLGLYQISFTASMLHAGGDNSVTASIEKDNAGLPGQEVFTTGAIMGQMGVLSSTTAPPVTIAYSAVSGGTALVAGATYWLTLTAPPDSQIAWNANGPQTIGEEEYLSNGVWTPSSKELGAFAIIATTPEPATWIMLSGGLTLLILAGQRKRRYCTRAANLN